MYKIDFFLIEKTARGVQLDNGVHPLYMGRSDPKLLEDSGEVSKTECSG